MTQSFAQISTALTSVQERIAAQREAVDATSANMFSAPGDGRWSDDGIRVTLPRLVTGQYVSGRRITVEPTGALIDLLHVNELVRLQIDLGDGRAASCTGSLVGSRLVLTNRHCVEDEGGGRFDPSQLTVRYAFHGATDVGLTTRASTFAVQQVVTSDGSLDSTSLNDWAFLILSKRATSTWLDVADPRQRTAQSTLRIAVAGYSSDLNKGSEITMDWGCRARWLPSGSITHRCRTFPGASGSPIVSVDGAFGRREVIGVHAAGARAIDAATGATRASASAEKYGTGSDEMYATYRDLKRQLGD